MIMNETIIVMITVILIVNGWFIYQTQVFRSVHLKHKL